MKRNLLICLTFVALVGTAQAQKEPTLSDQPKGLFTLKGSHTFLEFDKKSSLTFTLGGSTPVLQFMNNGDIIYKGRLLVTDTAIVKSFRELIEGTRVIDTTNSICKERGHVSPGAVGTNAAWCPPYTIDTRDSTITVYPACNSYWFTCTRCKKPVVTVEK